MADAHTMLAGTNSFEYFITNAALTVLEDSKLKGAYLLRKGWKTYEAALQDLNKETIDTKVAACVKFGAGLFLVLVSLIPPGIAQVHKCFTPF